MDNSTLYTDRDKKEGSTNEGLDLERQKQFETLAKKDELLAKYDADFDMGKMLIRLDELRGMCGIKPLYLHNNKSIIVHCSEFEVSEAELSQMKQYLNLEYLGKI